MDCKKHLVHTHTGTWNLELYSRLVANNTFFWGGALSQVVIVLLLCVLSV